MKLKAVLCSLALGLAGVSPALATPQVTINTHLGNPGEFQFDPNADFLPLFSPASYVPGKSVIGSWYGTFCLEYDEDVLNNHVYDAAVTQKAQNGGVNTDAGDPISKGVALLYKKFVLGSLAADGFVYNSTGANFQLQKAIWTLEDEGNFGIAGWIQTLLINSFGSVTNAKLDYVGNEVYAMNLTHQKLVGSGPDAHYVTVLDQDQLVYKVGGDTRKLPDGGTTAMLLGLGLLGLALAKRRL